LTVELQVNGVIAPVVAPRLKGEGH
jgi:hypothetical protein